MKPKPFASLNHFTVPCSIFFVFPGIELRWMNRSDHWQNLAWMGELLHTPESTLTLPQVYHSCQNIPAEICADWEGWHAFGGGDDAENEGLTGTRLAVIG